MRIKLNQENKNKTGYLSKICLEIATHLRNQRSVDVLHLRIGGGVEGVALLLGGSEDVSIK